MSQAIDPGVLVVNPPAVVPEKMRYDRGTVRRIVGPATGASSVDLHINTINVGSAPGPYHLHTNSENVYYVLGGEASIRSGEETYTAVKGQVVFISPNVPHAVSNNGSEELVIIEIYAPADADFKEVN
jgi:mannose-6-phosphate isomerase-like protein (cupin superfamily)